MKTVIWDIYPTDVIIDCLPQNRPLYKDSGIWQIWNDEFDEMINIQNVNESLRDFIIRYLETDIDDDDFGCLMVDLSCSI